MGIESVQGYASHNRNRPGFALPALLSRGDLSIQSSQRALSRVILKSLDRSNRKCGKRSSSSINDQFDDRHVYTTGCFIPFGQDNIRANSTSESAPVLRLSLTSHVRFRYVLTKRYARKRVNLAPCNQSHDNLDTFPPQFRDPLPFPCAQRY